MEISRRHHYVPQFLLRNFTDEQGSFYVYDKQKKTVTKTYPSKVFFTWDRNTVTVRDVAQNRDVELDNLEQLHSALDSRFAADLHAVLQQGKLDPEQIASIVLLASFLKWRTPLSDSQFDKLKHTTSLEKLGVRIQAKNKANQPDEAALEHLLNSELFKETKRFVLPLLPLLKGEKMLEIHNNSFIQHCLNQRAQALIGDCAILEQQGQGYDELGHFIFPLSTTATFVYKISPHLAVNSNLFYQCRDLATMHFSLRHVACRDEAYLRTLITQYYQMEHQPRLGEYLLKTLFDSV